jgi:hypothetical protein
MNEVTHNVCMGTCNGSSPEAGVCNSEGCTHKGTPLHSCDCTDGMHHKEVKTTEPEQGGEQVQL